MMNLVQIQERLKDMPVDAVIAYANGMNPEVPPYVALSELERRKRQDQVMQPAQAPTGTVKDKIEQQVGLAALQQQRQQAAMQQLASMAASPRDASIGGLPVPEQMFSGGGGIVAFADAGKVDAGKVDAEQLLGEQIKRVVPFLERQLPAEVMIDPFTREAALQEMYPERFKASRIPIGQQETERLRELQTAQAAEDARQKQALASRSRMDLFRSLIEGGERSRGQRGVGPVLGGIGSYLGPAMEQVEAAETAIRGRGLSRQEAMNKLQNEVLAAQRAKETGDLKAFSDHMNNVAKLQMELDASKSQPMSALTTGLATLVAQREGDAARIQQQQMANANALAVARQYGENSQEAEAARARAKLIEENTRRGTQERYEQLRRTQGQDAADRYLEDIAKIQAAISGVKYTGQDKSGEFALKVIKEVREDPTYKTLAMREAMLLRDPVKNKAEIDALHEQMEIVRQRVERQLGSARSSAAPPAPGAKPGAAEIDYANPLLKLRPTQ